jgi:thymidylate synthase
MVWIFNGSNESKIINFWNPALKIYAGQEEFYHGAYGYRIRKKYGIDQIERAYYALKHNPESRQVVMLIWNPNDDLPDVMGIPNNLDIPCNICSMLKIRDSKLEWTQIIRSNDIFRGVPYNFVQFTGFQEILAGWLEIEVGTYTQFSDSLHLYEVDEENLSICKRKYMKNSDNLSLPKPQSEAIFKEIFNRMIVISKGDISQEKLASVANLKSGYAAYDNIMFVLGAYAARKLKYKELQFKFIKSCSNELYKQMWRLWENQINDKGGI